MDLSYSHTWTFARDASLDSHNCEPFVTQKPLLLISYEKIFHELPFFLFKRKNISHLKNKQSLNCSLFPFHFIFI